MVGVRVTRPRRPTTAFSSSRARSTRDDEPEEADASPSSSMTPSPRARAMNDGDGAPNEADSADEWQTVNGKRAATSRRQSRDDGARRDASTARGAGTNAYSVIAPVRTPTRTVGATEGGRGDGARRRETRGDARRDGRDEREGRARRCGCWEE